MEYAFNIHLAKEIGLEEAIMMKHFQFWVSKNIANKKHLHDGHTWTYNSVKAFDSQFPFWTQNQIRRIIKSLEGQGIIKTGNYNSAKYDRTKWFAIIDEQRFVEMHKCNSAKAQMDLAKNTNGIVQTHKPIPVTTNTDTTNTDTTTIYKRSIDLYNQFCLDTFDAPAKIDGVQGKSMKAILKYLQKVSKQKGVNTPEGSLNALEYIFKNWNNIEPFLQKQVKLSQINSNLTNIIQQLKHGQESKSQSIADDILSKYR